MEKAEKIKNLLIDLKNDPRKILELEKFFVNDVVEVAFKNELYEPLVIAFQPITIDGEVKICLDAFSSDILNMLENAYDTKEEAEKEARQQYEEIQERNGRLSEEDKEFFYNASTYEDILASKIVIPKAIKATFKKMLFTINYEQIANMKIKNCHARQISGWNHPIDTIEDVMVYSELPCLMASIDLFNKNIRTTMNDTEGVLEDPTITDGVCKIWIDYSSLSQENKAVVEELIALGEAEKFMDNNIETVSIFVPCSREDTVREINEKLSTIVSEFKVQDVKYGCGTMEEIYQRYVPTLQRHPYYAEGLFTDGLNLKDLIELGNLFGENLYYDEEEGLIWITLELYQRHKRYVEAHSSKKDSQTSEHLQ